MPDDNLTGPWARPTIPELDGRYVRIARLNADADIHDLYDVSHRTDEFKALWRYLWNGPFTSQDEMYRWLVSAQDGSDPMCYTVFSRELGCKVGMFSLLHIPPDMGRLEFGHIWYSPLVQHTKVNSEVTYLFLCHAFDDLRYRRVEWKCDDRNEPSKRTARRMGFQFEGVFRKHMLVKGQNRDTAWFSMLDDEWATRKANFEKYLSAENVSLTQLNAH